MSYNNNKIKNMPAYSMGKSKRQASFVPRNQNPGIGAYNTNGWVKQSKQKSGLATSMARAPKFLSSLENSLEKVGPGTYSPEKLYTNLKPSIKGRHNIRFKTDAPGPAEYNPKISYGIKQYSFGNSRRRLIETNKCEVAPNSYTIPSQLGKTGISFCKQQRTKISKERVPGPGSYTQSSDRLKKGEFSFSHQKKFLADQMIEKQKSMKPAPNVYNIGQFKKNIRGGKFYQTSRDCIKIQEGKPGPADYHSTKCLTKTNPRAVIGNQMRSKDKDNHVPGPGQYNSVPSQVTKKNHGKMIFPKGQRDSKISEGPGPGQYETNVVKNVRASSISARNFFTKQQKFPGPQDYNPEYRHTISKNGQTKFGKQQKSKRVKTQTPGPGAYKLASKQFSKTFFFDKSKKEHNQLSESSVGPGQYKLKPYIGQYDGLIRDQKDVLYV